MRISSIRLQKSRPEEWMGQAKVLVFDFDGTLVDSNPIKWRAFSVCFEGFPRKEEIVSYCAQHPHIPRGDKFRYAFEEILKIPYTPDAESSLHERFEAETTRQIMQASALPGVEPFLARASHRYLCALLSATPHDILLEILRGRDWEGYFRLVRGAPVHKGHWLADLKVRYQLAADQLVFFGDTTQDAQAAAWAACRFVSINPSEGFASLLADLSS